MSELYIGLAILALLGGYALWAGTRKREQTRKTPPPGGYIDPRPGPPVIDPEKPNTVVPESKTPSKKDQ